MNNRYRRLTTGLAMLLCALFAVPAAAQDTNTDVTPEFDLALAALNQGLRTNITADDLDELEFSYQQFEDASLGCPQPDQMYTQVLTPGYQFLLSFRGIVYDYRVSEDGNRVILCDTRPVVPAAPTLVAPPSEDCDSTYTVAQNDRLLEIARRCNTSVAALMAANPAIPYPSLIYAGMTLTIPDGTGFRAVAVGAQDASPGELINIYASGFPPGAQVQIGFGPPESEYEVVATREIASDGELYAAIRIPTYYRVGEELVGVVVLNGQETVSDPFILESNPVPPIPSTPLPTAPPEGALFDGTYIYLVALSDQGQTGQPIGCGDSLIPIMVTFEPTVAPLTAALGELFAIDTRTYGQSGLYNPLYRSNLQVEGIDIENRAATINLSGDLRTGGVCDTPRVRAVLEQTALQYPTIDRVNVNLNGQPLENALS